MGKVCLYNNDDLDGICSAAIIKHKYPDTILYPIKHYIVFDYNKVIDNDVYIVDCALRPFVNMVHLNKKSNLIWIDHHDSSIKEYNDLTKYKNPINIKGNRSTNKSSCEITWDLIYPDKHIPYTVWLMGRYSLLEYDKSDSVIPFQYGMRLNFEKPDVIKYWNDIFNKNRDDRFIQNIIKRGYVIIDYHKALNEKLCTIQMFESMLFKYRCICINRSLCGSSVFDSVYDPDKHDIMVVFYICARGNWNVSLYSKKNDIDVSVIATEFGGGGNSNASSFRCSILPFDIIN